MAKHYRWRQFKNEMHVRLPNKARRQSSHYGTLFLPAFRLVEDVSARIDGRGVRRLRAETLQPLINELRRLVVNDPHNLTKVLALLLVQTPQAVRAQQQMDAHPHGYKNKHQRLYELIDFNDTFVAAVLLTPRDALPLLGSDIKRALDTFCYTVRNAPFSDEQFAAIVRGLSREVALFLATASLGYHVKMTDRSQDALGVDMVITDATSGKALNVDCKSRSAFRHRLRELVNEGRMTEEQLEVAIVDGFAAEINGRGDEAVSVVVLQIDEETYGVIDNFEIPNKEVLADRLASLMEKFGAEAGDTKNW